MLSVIQRSARVLVAAIVVVLLHGCALSFVPQERLDAPAVNEDGVLVVGRITYMIDGEVKLPYGSPPAIPSPALNLLHLESGNPFIAHVVNDADGSFTWRMTPGHYVISGVGRGMYTDPLRIVWPRLAFRVTAGAGPVYLGDLQLRGKRYTRTFTYSTGREDVSRGIDFEFMVEDAPERHKLPAGTRLEKSLIFERSDMPIGDTLVIRWDRSKEKLIEEIFSPPRR